MIKIIDNCCPIDIQNEIEKQVQKEERWLINNERFNQTRLTGKRYGAPNVNLTKPCCFFVPLNITDSNKKFNLKDSLYLKPLVAINRDKPEDNYKVQINYKRPVPYNMFADDDEFLNCNLKHIDVDPEKYGVEEYTVAVYYISSIEDSRAGTYIFKERIGDLKGTSIDEAKLTLDVIVKPKKGRLAVFDWDIIHLAGYPETQERYIINYNFKPL